MQYFQNSKPKSFYSLIDYIFVTNKRKQGAKMHFTSIKKTKHYKEYHEKFLPWSKVIEITLTTKQRRKKGDKIEIKTDKFYILCELKDKTLWVINAKLLK